MLDKKKYPYAFAPVLIRELDSMVRNPSEEYYVALRGEILRRLMRAEVVNPFHAGAPPKYLEEDEIKASALKAEGKTTRQIAKEMGCSQSTVVRLLNRKYE